MIDRKYSDPLSARPSAHCRAGCHCFASLSRLAVSLSVVCLPGRLPRCAGLDWRVSDVLRLLQASSKPLAARRKGFLAGRKRGPVSAGASNNISGLGGWSVTPFPAVADNKDSFGRPGQTRPDKHDKTGRGCKSLGAPLEPAHWLCPHATPWPRRGIGVMDQLDQRCSGA